MMLLMEYGVGDGMRSSLPKTRHSNCSSWQPSVLLGFWEEAPWPLPWFGFQLYIGSPWSLPWWPSAGNAICVMGPNFLETDHPWFLTLTAGLVGWMSSLGEPNPRPAPTCRALLAPPLWVSTVHQFGQINGGWWTWPVERHGSAILVYPPLVGSPLVVFFILAPQHLAHGGLIEAGGCQWLCMVFLELKMVGMYLMEPYVVKNRTH